MKCETCVKKASSVDNSGKGPTISLRIFPAGESASYPLSHAFTPIFAAAPPINKAPPNFRKSRLVSCLDNSLIYSTNNNYKLVLLNKQLS